MNSECHINDSIKVFLISFWLLEYVITSCKPKPKANIITKSAAIEYSGI